MEKVVPLCNSAELVDGGEAVPFDVIFGGQTCRAFAIRYEGSTLGDGTYRNALNQVGDYQNHHRVYDRANEACSSCGAGSLIVRIVQALRATFFCPGCQRKR